MHNRTIAGSTRALLLIAAIVGLILLPAMETGAAAMKSRSNGTSAASPSRGVGALAEDSVEPQALFPRANYWWPFRTGPSYGLELGSAAVVDEPGIVRTQVGAFDLRRGTPADLPAELRVSPRIGMLGFEYFLLVPNPEDVGAGRFDGYRDEIVSQGGAFVAEMGSGAYLVRLNAAAHASIAGHVGTLALEPYHPAFKLAPSIGRSPLPSEVDAMSDSYKLAIRVHRGEDTGAVAQAVSALGGIVIRFDPVTVYAVAARSALSQIASITAVEAVFEDLPVVPFGEETTTVMQTGSYHGGAKPFHDVRVNGGGRVGTCTAGANPGAPRQSNDDCNSPSVTGGTCPLGGPAQVLMILDSGIQIDNGDLSDTRATAGAASATHRKVRVYQTTDQFGGAGDGRGCDDQTNGAFTHGHVVAATALGNATAVPLRYGAGFQKLDITNVPRPVDGVATRAVLVAYDAHVTPISGACTSPLNDSLEEGTTYAGEGAAGSLEISYHTHGARTFNFSWGTTGDPSYGTNAAAVDDFLSNAAHQDAMLFLAAGNAGRDADLDGVPDPGSISEPATAKNAAVVGGSGNTSEPFNDANEQDRFGNSGVGPANTTSGRVAPILMAPGADFGAIGDNMGFDSEYSCRSVDNNQIGTPECDLSQGIFGTSFSSPAAAGAAMLVRDYFGQGFYPDGTSSNPGNAADVVTALSGAAVKAVLIASADWMDDSTPAVPTNRRGGNLFANYRFNNEQGYGRVQLNNALPLQNYNSSPTGMLIADGGITGGRLDIAGLTGDVDTGLAQTDTGTFTVCNDAQELRVSLVWIDSSGNLLNRNLDLEVQAPSGKIYYGNYFTDDDNKNQVIDAGEDCPNAHLTGSVTSLDESPWSLETCANSDRDNTNPTEAVYLSPDARNDTRASGFEADKQTEVGTWTVRVRTGTPTTAAVQRYAVVVTGGVCAASAVQLDSGSYVCNQPVTLSISEKDEAVDPTGSITNAEAASRTLLQVVSKGTDGIYGTGDDVVVDTEDSTSTSNFGITSSGTKYTSAALTLTDSTSRVGSSGFGNGVLDARHNEVIKVSYRDETSGVLDANKVRTSTSIVSCQPTLDVGRIKFGQFGLDTVQLVDGGCERDARGLFTFGHPDKYMDEGERFLYRVVFQSADSDLIDVDVSLRCVCADSDSPAECQPGSLLCADPNRLNNPACGPGTCGVNITILDSPKNIGDLPAGQVTSPSFAVQMGTITGRPEVDMLVGVSARKSGKTVENLIATRNTLNSDEESFYYSTDYPAGGTEWLDVSMNEMVDGCVGGGTCPNPAFGNGSAVPTTSVAEADFNSDYRFEQATYSSLTATGRNLGAAPWNFDSSNNGFSVGWNNTTTVGLFTETIANWGEDKNFNGALDYACTGSPTTACPGEFPLNLCGRCNLSTATICTDNVDCGPNGPCAVSTALGTCFSDEDRDPQNGLLDNNWGTGGGCGWQTNGTTNNPNLSGGIWHTGRIDLAGAAPCLVSGNNVGACQDYETLTGTANIKVEYELLMSPIFQKVNQCNTDLGPLPSTCNGQLDTPTRKVWTVEFTGWGWNMAADLKDRFAAMLWELDTDVNSLTPIDLVNDGVVLRGFIGPSGAVTHDGGRVFALFATPSGGASRNGIVGKNRVGRNPCYFEVNPVNGGFATANPSDDDIDNDADGTPDESVFPNGPLRNLDTSGASNSPVDYRFSTIEDVYAAEGLRTPR